MTTNDSVLIVGAGVFGLSTAYHLLKRDYSRVTVLDKSTVLPAPDGASVDINRIVRLDKKISGTQNYTTLSWGLIFLSLTSTMRQISLQRPFIHFFSP